MELVKTGIKGADELLNGGIPQNKNLLVIGGPGTGKTIFALQYIVKGATEYGEKGIFITTEQYPAELRKDAMSLGWDLKQLEEEGLIYVLNAVPIAATGGGEKGYVISEPHPFLGYLGFNTDDLLSLIFDVKRKVNATRVAIDSISQLLFFEPDSFKTRINIIRFINSLKNQGMTVVTTAQYYAGEPKYHELLTFIADGVVVLHLLRQGDIKIRAFEVIKMRGVGHSLKSVLMEIKKDGIFVDSTKSVKLPGMLPFF